MALFRNRQEAAQELARSLSYLKGDQPIVLGLANAGVPVAEIVATQLEAPLDILLIERLLSPQPPRHVVGAVDEHGRISMIQSTARWHHLTSQQMVEPARDLFRSIQQRRGRFRGILPQLDLRDQVVIIVGDGVDTGATMLGAIASVRDRGARKIIAAAPAGSSKATWQLNEIADMVVIPHRPSQFTAVSKLYAEYTDVADDLVSAIIGKWVKSRPQDQSTVRTLVMRMANDLGQALFCEIDLPPGCTRGSGPYPAVVFAHNYESDGRSPRTVPISQRIAKRNILGVRLDFTGHGRSEGELWEATDQRMFNDLQTVYRNICNLTEVDETQIGLAGSGTGSMLCAELAQRLSDITVMVIRSPLSGKEIRSLENAHAPTLVVHAGQEESIDEASARMLPSRHQLLEIPDANRLFNDAISLEMMVGASVDWLIDHLTGIPATDESLVESGQESESSPTEAQ